MAYSSKIMILMMGLSKNLKSHTPLSWPNITRVPISHTSVSLIDRYNQEKWNCDLAGRTAFGRGWFSSKPSRERLLSMTFGWVWFKTSNLDRSLSMSMCENAPYWVSVWRFVALTIPSKIINLDLGIENHYLGDLKNVFRMSIESF